jgi:hypothetical protein
LSIANDDTDEAQYEATEDNMPAELSRYFENKDDEYVANKIILKPYIIYPEYMHKIIWDIFMSFILVLSCVLTPVDLAFPAIRDQNKGYDIFMYTIDFLFLCDILATFISAFEDYDLKINDDLKDISLNYLKGWFAIDFISILPIDLIFLLCDINIGGYNKVFRVLRMGKL